MKTSKSDMKIKLDKAAGPIVFLGGMNAMPMMYALELRNQGYDVLYVVDRPQKDKLSRPENHFSEIQYPYPDWVLEVNLASQILIMFFGRFLCLYFLKKVLKATDKAPQLFILNGFFISFSKYFSKKGIKTVALSHGADLDTWADVEGVNKLKKSFSEKSVFKFIPKLLSGYFISSFVRKQFSSLLLCSGVIYFPKGFNENGDRVIRRLEEKGVNTYERYDISFEPLKGQNREFKDKSKKLIIFSGVRFLYKTFPDGNEGYCKGNDFIIKGLAKLYKTYPNIEVHFVDKGEDVEAAKKLCDEVGLSSAVVWHKEMKFIELLELYDISDICFDQVGAHWIGAIGGYALWLGKPLIANDQHPVKTGFWPESNPVCSAKNAQEVYEWLVKLTDENERKKISSESKVFVEKYMSCKKLLEELFDIQ